MKSNIFFKSVSLLLVAGFVASCSSDYLDNEPETSLPATEATASTEAAQMSVYGICRAMFTQYTDDSFYIGMNGEGTLNFSINETLGPDYTSRFMYGLLFTNYYHWRTLNDPKNAIISSAWMYCYNIINQANTIIENIESAEGEKADREFIEAQARTFRAFGYIKALQWFGPRWQDSDNGEKMAVVYRDKSGSDPAPLASMNKVLQLIYSDLDRSIELFKSSGKKRSQSFEPDLNVAYGLYARAALLRNDWSTARTMAHNARAGKQLMTNEDYLGGFIKETKSIMWTNPENDIYYWATGNGFSSNGFYPRDWKWGTAINIDLYRKLNPADIRRKPFCTPDKVAEISQISGYEGVAVLTEADFWDINNLSIGDLNLLNASGGSNSKLMKSFCKGFLQYCQDINKNASSCLYKPYSVRVAGKPSMTSCVLGAATKFWSTGEYGDMKYPYMRVEEMVLTEAEAAYMEGDIAAARACLSELNSIRIPGYSCNLSGDALLEEIRISRRIELWGEGFCWIDFKRWNLPCEERVWEEGNVNSGNTPAMMSESHSVSDCNGWRLAIPQAESDYNPAFDRSLVN